MNETPGQDPDDESGLPEGFDRDKLDELVRRVEEVTGHLGLHAHPMYQIKVIGEPPVQHVLLEMGFAIGKLAFAKPVQNPQQAKVDDTFRSMEQEFVKDQRESIVDKYRKKRVDGAMDDGGEHAPEA